MQNFNSPISNKKKYLFDRPLQEALILRRPNRFLFEVLMKDGKKEICHCPATGRIGNIVFNNIPCLISNKEENISRKTKWTTEAISLNDVDEKNKKWIGINQNMANRFIEFFIKTNQLNEMIKFNGKLLREQKIDNSKLDFLIDNTYIEIKTPLIIMPLKKNYITNKDIEIKEKTKFNSFDRFIKHINELTSIIKAHQKAILIHFYIFEADRFIPPKIKKHPIMQAITKALKNGVELWQVNAKIDNVGVELVNYYRNDLN